ncbi:MAG: histidinol dehydrogenase, partial [Sediminicola sp.]
MKEIKYPSRANWPKLLKRPEFERNQFTKVVSDILAEVKQNGDSALIKFTEKFDGVKLDSLLVSQKEIEIAISQVSEELANAIKLAKAN